MLLGTQVRCATNRIVSAARLSQSANKHLKDHGTEMSISLKKIQSKVGHDSCNIVCLALSHCTQTSPSVELSRRLTLIISPKKIQSGLGQYSSNASLCHCHDRPFLRYSYVCSSLNLLLPSTLEFNVARCSDQGEVKDRLTRFREKPLICLGAPSLQQ